jgi:rhamnosyltransferase
MNLQDTNSKFKAQTFQITMDLMPRHNPLESDSALDRQGGVRHLLSQTMATLVLYNSSLEKSPTYQSLSRVVQLEGMVINALVYDNSAGPQHIHPANGWNAAYVHDASNSGVSKAFNTGASLAANTQKKWLLLLDQDTTFPPDFFYLLWGAVRQFPNEKLFAPVLHDKKGIVSPFHYLRGGGSRVSSVSAGVASLHDIQPVNSGLFISLDAFREVGGYDERLGLDFSDFGFMERFRKTCSSFVVTGAACRHEFSGTSNSAAENLSRFSRFVKAGLLFRKWYRPADLWIPARMLYRSLKLAVVHRSMRFLIIFIRSLWR